MKRPSNIEGYSLEELAQQIGNLRYDRLHLFLSELSNKIGKDESKDRERGKNKLADILVYKKHYLKEASLEAKEAWELSKPYMGIKEFKNDQGSVDCIQFNNLNREQIEDFIGEPLKVELESETAYLAGKGAPIFSITVGGEKMFPSDWIACQRGLFYVCNNEEFLKTHTK